MLQKDNRYMVLSVFFEDPVPKGIGFQLREISRKVKVAPASVKNYLKELEKEGLVKREKHRIYGYPVYYANRESEYFRSLKRADIEAQIVETGLLSCLNDACMPDAIILFGSASRGEDVKDSDIDLFLLCKEKKLDLGRYERQLNRRINVFFSDNFSRLSGELKNNIINGVILKGYLKVF
jgi:predicted nucleotidyltransferase